MFRFQQNFNSSEQLLSPSNVDRKSLERYAIEAATFSTKGELGDLEFEKNHKGENDVALFDFTSLFAAENASRIVEKKGKRILMCLAGDSLLEVSPPPLKISWLFSIISPTGAGSTNLLLTQFLPGPCEFVVQKMVRGISGSGSPVGVAYAPSGFRGVCSSGTNPDLSVVAISSKILGVLNLVSSLIPRNEYSWP